MKLPPELRDYIYELALTNDGGLKLVSKTKAYRRTIARGVIHNDGENGYYRRRNRWGWTQTNDNEDDSSEEEPAYNSLAPNLLAVNKQIHSEAIGYLYQQPIMLEDTMALHTWLAAIGPKNRLQPLDITVKSWGDGRGTHKAMNVAALTMMAGCTNIRSFNLDCEVGHVRQPKHLAQQLYRDGHYFFEAYGAANGKRDAGIDVIQLNEWNYDKGYYWGGYRRNITLPEMDEFKKQFRAELSKLLGAQ